VSTRLWYPQLDVYDAIRRVACLISRWEHRPPSTERLYILDFYFASPSLLHRVSMPQNIRSAFQALGVVHPDHSFLSYPSAPILFKKMESIQKEAIRTLAGKDLINLVLLEKGEVKPSLAGTVLFSERFSHMLTQSERPILEFLISHFSTIGLDDIRDLRSRTGLRRMIG
jgi:hypothetical protein